MNKLSGWQDTIVAPATAPGVAAIGVIRVSGSNAIDIVNEIFPSKDLTQQQTHTLHFGTIQMNGHILDEVLVSLFKGPKSYTGENTIEQLIDFDYIFNFPYYFNNNNCINFIKQKEEETEQQ